MTIARVADGAVVEMRPIEITDVPEHKRALWLPVIEEGSGSLLNVVIESDRVRRVRSEPALDVVKAAARADVNAEAEATRLRYITPGAGQALTYREKAAEAQRFVQTTGAGAYPFLDAMVAAGRAADRAAAASSVLAAEAQWTQIGAAIEQAREAAIVAIAAATTADQVRAAAQVTWP